MLLFRKWEDLTRCEQCENYEPEDLSVGIYEGCTVEDLYNDKGEIIESVNNEIIFQQAQRGAACPYFVENTHLKNRLQK